MDFGEGDGLGWFSYYCSNAPLILFTKKQQKILAVNIEHTDYQVVPRVFCQSFLDSLYQLATFDCVFGFRVFDSFCLK